MTAVHYRLDNLVAIVDRNGLQITGSTEDVCQLSPLDEKFEAFGFAVHRCDGNDVGELVRVLGSVPFRPGKPSLELTREDSDLLVVTSNSRGSAKLTPFARAAPGQIVEIGIAEQNLVGVTAGLAAARMQQRLALKRA